MKAYKRQCGEGEGYRGGVETITIEAPELDGTWWVALN